MYSCPVRTVAAVIGCLALLRFSLRFLSNACKWLRAYFLAPWGIGRTDLKRYGPWAGEWIVSLYFMHKCLSFCLLTESHLGEVHLGEGRLGEVHLGEGEGHLGEGHLGEVHLGGGHLGGAHLGEDHLGDVMPQPPFINQP